MYQPDVYVSLTTIPTRLGTLKDNLIALSKQDYANFKGIFLTVPQNNIRGLKWEHTEFPEWLSEIPNLNVLRPVHDRGPIMKYLGSVIEGKLPSNAWLFVCDDDIEYKSNAISTYIADLNATTTEKYEDTIVNFRDHKRTLYWMYGIPNADFIPGFEGVLVSHKFAKSLLDALPEKMPDCCVRIDDDVVSTFAKDLDYRKITASKRVIEKFDEVSITPLNATNRDLDRHECHTRLNPTYNDNIMKMLLIMSGFLIGTLLTMVFLVGGSFTPVTAIPVALLIALSCAVTCAVVIKKNSNTVLSNKLLVWAK
jgi:hypothetical protein